MDQTFGVNNENQKFALHMERETLIQEQEYHMKLSGNTTKGITGTSVLWAVYDQLTGEHYDVWKFLIAPKDGYYIVNKFTGEYLTAEETSLDTRIFFWEKADDVDPDSQIWNITIGEYGRVRIRSEYHRKNNIALYLGLDSDDYYLSQCPTASAEEWVLEQVTPYALLYGVIDYREEGHDHVSSLTFVQNLLNEKNYNAIVDDGRLYPVSCLDQMAYMATIVTTRSHGKAVRSYEDGPLLATGVELYTYITSEWLYSHNNINYNSTEDAYIPPTMTFCNLDLAVFVGCYTGVGGEGANNLPSVLVEQGAQTAIGFQDTIDCSLANTWIRTFYHRLYLGYTVENAVYYANNRSYMNLAVICGNQDYTLY